MITKVSKGSVEGLLKAIDQIDGAYTGRTDNPDIQDKDIPDLLAEACRGYLGIKSGKTRQR